MTKEQIQVAIAKLDGWNPASIYKTPDYLNLFDAILPVIKNNRAQHKIKFIIGTSWLDLILSGI